MKQVHLREEDASTKNGASPQLLLVWRLREPPTIVDHLRRTCGALRTSTTKIINEVESIMEVTLLPMGELTEHLNMLKLKETALMDLEGDIEHRVPNEDLKEEFATAERCRDSHAFLH